ncbi:hypothetical protein ACFSL6_08920 [Paenibacillus thailandensis]|uniref:Rho termination factor N-terminal domain-containing protein n=1 Tax=Paenibacillus thailandensis TaxID=393250 RepID=A0ABW5QSP5_9BACL
MYKLQLLNVVKITDSTAKAQQLRTLGYKDIESVAEKEEADKPVGEMTVTELKAYAKANSIDLGEATKKDEILAKIKEAEGGE